ncbi:MAG: hypothetical protein IPL46_17165 [Saprospiraceae bacterium]|nr:hypothetical protein [Saprospiraceae bacterium]
MEKFYYVLWLLFNITYTSTAQTVVFTGAGNGTHWADQDNWSTGSLPGNTDDVLINAGRKVILNEVNAEINTLVLDSADLVISTNVSLTLVKNTPYGGHVRMQKKSKLLNMGKIVVESGSDAIFIDTDGYLENENNILVLESDDNGILNKGVLDNKIGGIIELYNGDDHGFYGPGSIVNHGKIALYNCGNSWCGGMLENKPTGEIIIRKSTDYPSLELSGSNSAIPTGINVYNKGRFINQGNMNISHTSRYASVGVYDNAVFDHQAGQINIFDVGSSGIQVVGGKFFIQGGAAITLENGQADLLDIRNSTTAHAEFECWGVLDLKH